MFLRLRINCLGSSLLMIESASSSDLARVTFDHKDSLALNLGVPSSRKLPSFLQ